MERGVTVFTSPAPVITNDRFGAGPPKSGKAVTAMGHLITQLHDLHLSHNDNQAGKVSLFV